MMVQEERHGCLWIGVKKIAMTKFVNTLLGRKRLSYVMHVFQVDFYSTSTHLYTHDFRLHACQRYFARSPFHLYIMNTFKANSSQDFTDAFLFDHLELRFALHK